MACFATAGPGLDAPLPSLVHRADVLVIGAGASGIPAALAAARCGARVILLEEDPVPGGAPVDNYVAMLCGGPRRGLFLELAHRLNARHNLPGRPANPFRDGGLDGRDYWYLPTAYAQELTAMLAAEPLITVHCGAAVSRVVLDLAGPRRRVCGAVVDRPGLPPCGYLAPITIDATGTGLVAALAGCACQYGRNARRDFGEAYGPDQADLQVQPCTWMFISQRLRPDARFPDALLGSGFVESNYGWVQRDDTAMHERGAGCYLHWGATVTCADTRDPLALAQAQSQALAKLEAPLALLREHGYAVHLAPRLGVREGRRVLGEYVVTATDLLASRYPEDTIAHCAFFLDAWGEHHQLPRTPVEAGIPYRALIPRDTEGLLVAGRAISGTHLAMSAYRVQPIMASVGTAAGLAAALAGQLGTGLREVPLATLQQQLRELGTLPA